MSGSVPPNFEARIAVVHEIRPSDGLSIFRLAAQLARTRDEPAPGLISLLLQILVFDYVWTSDEDIEYRAAIRTRTKHCL